MVQLGTQWLAFFKAFTVRTCANFPVWTKSHYQHLWSWLLPTSSSNFENHASLKIWAISFRIKNDDWSHMVESFLFFLGSCFLLKCQRNWMLTAKNRGNSLLFLVSCCADTQKNKLLCPSVKQFQFMASTKTQTTDKREWLSRYMNVVGSAVRRGGDECVSFHLPSVFGVNRKL